MARSQKTAGFASAVKKAGGEAWENSRSVKSSNFEQDVVDDGTYVATLSSGRTGSDKNDNPYAAFDFTIERGEFKGATVSKFHSIAERGERTIEQAMQSLFIDLKRLSDGDVDFDTVEPEDIEDLVVDLTEESPVISIGVRNSEYNGKNYINVFINKRLDDDAAPAVGSDGVEGDYDPEVGDWYLWKAPRTKSEAEFVVTAVGKDETVDLKRRKDDKEFKGIAWTDLGEYVDIPF